MTWLLHRDLVLIVLVAGLAALALFQGRGLFGNAGGRLADSKRIRLLRRYPKGEGLSPGTLIADALSRLQRDHARWHASVEELTEGLDGYACRIREEIDRLAGKEEYHGHKEQL